MFARLALLVCGAAAFAPVSRGPAQQTARFGAKVDAILEEIKTLNRIEASELVGKMESTFKNKAPAAAEAAPEAAAEEAAAEEPAAEEAAPAAE
mmetsp:Transcript_15038/g.52358  ORF Transcript_15038/g.52358 Transcript_15038/m.52358 type:complete len:94 (+) Transcript_15038:67-348(+)